MEKTLKKISEEKSAPDEASAAEEVPALRRTVSVRCGSEEVNGKFSLKGEHEVIAEIIALTKRAEAEGWSEERLREATTEAVDRIYEGLADTHGAMKEGEKPTRSVQDYSPDSKEAKTQKEPSPLSPQKKKLRERIGRLLGRNR